MNLKKSMLAVALIGGLGLVGAQASESTDVRSRPPRERVKGTPPNPANQSKAQKKAARRARQRERRTMQQGDAGRGAVGE